MSGLVTFRLGEREYATPLTAVREVVRLQGLADLPGMQAPLAGVLDLRGTALPVLDLRDAAAPQSRGDVLVLERHAQDGAEGRLDTTTLDTTTLHTTTLDTTAVGVAVDQVRAVVAEGELVPAGTGAEQGLLPSYVLEVLRGRDGVVFLVDLSRMVESTRATV